MPALTVMIDAVTAGAAGATALTCFLLWRVGRRDPVLGWFSLMAFAHMVYASFQCLRNGAEDVATMGLALRVTSLCFAPLAVGLVMVFRGLAGAHSWRLDRPLFALFAVFSLYGLIEPGGWYLDRLDGISVVELPWLGKVTTPVGSANRLHAVGSLIQLLFIARLAFLAGTLHRDRMACLVLGLVPAAMTVAWINGWALVHQWWVGIPLGQYTMLMTFVVLGFILVRRELLLTAQQAEREAEISALLEHGLTFTVLLDASGRVLLANRLALTEFGLPYGAVAGRPLSETPWWKDPEEGRLRLEKGLAKARAGGQDRFITVQTAAGGRTIEVDVSIAPAYDSSGQMRYLICEGRDITALRQYERRLREGSRFEAIGQLAGGIAHDFNNLLTGMIGAAELAQRHTSEAGRGRLRTIISTGIQAADLTRKLLSFARRGKMRNVPVSINTLVEESGVLVVRSGGPPLVIERRLETHGDEVIGDPSELQSAILNLCINGRDAMPAGGTLTLATTRVHLDRAECERMSQPVEPGPFIRIDVTDTGTGMDDTVLRRVFEPFFSTKGNGQGTGLGMPAVLGTVLEHRGAISIRSAPGQGTTVSLWLPASANASALGREASSRFRIAVQGQGSAVVVDDEPLLAEIMSEMLTELGFTVRSYTDPVLARGHLCSPGATDCVLLDLTMPGLSGRELYRELRQHDRDVPIIISSGFAVKDRRFEGAVDPNLCFLPKPWNKRQLREVLVELSLLSKDGPVQPGS